MALTGTNRGVSGNNTAATSLAIVPASNFTAGALAILCVSYDNSGASGADPFTTITDTVGNTWTSRINRLNDPGAASAGAALRIFTSKITTLTTANTITVSFSASTTAKAWTLTEVTAGAGFVPVYSSGNSTAQTTATPTITSTSIPLGGLILGVAGGEGNGTTTGDADTTNGTWSTQQETGFGTTTGGIEITSQFKVVTAAATQTYNPTFSASTDNNIAWISIIEAGLSFDPMGMLGFFGM